MFLTIGVIAPGQAEPLNCPIFGLNLQPGAIFTFNGDTTGQPHTANNYNCTTWDEYGSEVVYRGYSTAIHGDLSATLTNLNGVDLDVFILKSCDSNNCVAFGNYTADYDDAPPGTYFLVVDGYGSEFELSHKGPYTITITAECSPAVGLTLRVPYSSETNGGPPAYVSAYNCSPWNESGPEVIHQITTTKTGILRASLSNLEADLDVFILSSCEADACLAYGNTVAEFADAPPDTYYIVVDGYNGAQGGYTLTVDNISCENVICYDGNDCTQDICDPQTGTCIYPNMPAGASCGNTSNTDCNNPDTCNGAGQCLPNNEPYGIACTSDGNQCTTDICNGTGICIHPNKPSGSACGDPSNTDCTNPDTCNGSGLCLANNAPYQTACTDDGNDCTSDWCNSAGTCIHPNKPSGSACGDPSDTDCTDPDTCNGAGLCLANHASYNTPCPDQWFCNGAESCDGVGNCQAGVFPCLANEMCDENGDRCNQPPESTIDSPIADEVTIYVGEAVSFAGTGQDSDGDMPLTYHWTFGEGSGITNYEFEDPGAITFNYPGIFTVKLTVTDATGLADSSPAIKKVRVIIPAAADTSLQRAAMDLLIQESETVPRIRFAHGIPRFVEIQLRLEETLPDDPVVKSLTFLNTYRDLYRFYNPLRQLYLKRIVTEENLEQHMFYGQHWGNIPVFAAELVLHLEGDEVTLTNGNYLPEIPLFPPPSLDALMAQNIALDHASASAENLTPIGEVKLMYFNKGLISGQPDETHLAWRVLVHGQRTIDGFGIPWMYFIDAHNGEVLFTLELVNTADRPGEDFDIEHAHHDKSTATVCCYCIGSDADRWFDEDGPCCDYPGTYPGADTDVDDAYDLTHQVYHYFYDNFKRQSYDGDEEDVEVYAHVGTGWGNAQYRPDCDIFEFGDGYVVLDIFAHEFTHGVTASSSDLVYADQSGALNESYSDVFGAMLDTANWTIGENLPTGAARNMSNPPARGNPDHMDPAISGDGVGLRNPPTESNRDSSNDWGKVHINCGIPNKAAYLIAEGGTHNGLVIHGIGRQKTGRLYYDVLTKLLPSNAQFEDAKDNTIAQATKYAWGKVPDLPFVFTFNDKCDVINAFAAVGLGSPDRDCDGQLDDVDTDDDGDYIGDSADNCPLVRNPDQQNTDGDGQGDACDPDDDDDGILDDGDGSNTIGDNPCTGGFTSNCDDNCQITSNPNQADDDSDGIGDVCDDDDLDGVMNPQDNCRSVPNMFQFDNDGDGQGDACDPDDDDDGILDNGDGTDTIGDHPCTLGFTTNCDDNCRLKENSDQQDTDNDYVGDECDNCPNSPDFHQRDIDGDGLGDVCDPDMDGDGIPNEADPCPGAYNRPNEPFVNGMPLACYRAGGYIAREIQSIEIQIPTQIFRIPIFPCLAEDLQVPCPEWLPASYRSEVRVSMPFDLPARIVSDRGLVVGKSGPGLAKNLGFHPNADYFFRPPAQIGTGAAAQWQQSLVAQSSDNDVFSGTSYFLEIFTSSEVVPGQEYPIAIEILADTDGDRMDDAWERAHGLDPGSDDAGADPDEDGFTNIEEYRAGTDPQDDTSFPQPPCPGDLNEDGSVNDIDLATFALEFGRTNCTHIQICKGDIIVNGVVDGSDLYSLASDFGRIDCPQTD